MAMGVPSLAAGAMATGPIMTVTPAGASQTTAALLTTPSSILGTAAAAGVLLPPSSGQPEMRVYNNSGNAQNVYPAVGETINALTANTAVSVTAAKAATFVPGDKGWLFVPGA
jgi:hypothetical protein